MILAAVAVAVGAAVAGVVVWTSRGASAPVVAATHMKPLSGQPPVAVELPGPALSRFTPAVVLAAAEHRLPAGDLRIQVVRAMALYLPKGPHATIAALRRLPQNQAAVAFNLGVAEYWSGDTSAASASLMLTRRLDPYGFYGLRADNLLYPPYPSPGGHVLPGYPPYTSSLPRVTSSVASLRREADTHPGDANAWLRLATALEGSNRVAAIAAARRALADDPNGVSPQVALAVLGFDKANPKNSVGTLGNLLARLPQSSEIRFHLGILLFWILDKGDAASEFRQVVLDDPNGPYGRLAKVFSACLTNGCPNLVKTR